MRETLSGYTFSVKWVPGKNHQITDTLSQAPFFAPEEESNITIDTALTCLCMTQDPAYHMLQPHIDDDYILCTTDIMNNTSKSSLIQTLSGVRNRLSLQSNLILLDSTRIIPPTSAIKDLIIRLHAGHGGQEKTLSLANKLFYWPGMTNDIRTFIQACKPCYKRLPSQKKNPSVTSPPSESFGPPLAQVGLDLFDFGGKKHLICVDRWSGFPLCKQLQSQSTKAITNILASWFNILGWPATIQSDGGPQFCGPFKAVRRIILCTNCQLHIILNPID